MSSNCYRFLLVLASLLCFSGCVSFGYPSGEKRLFSWQIPKDKVQDLKDTIAANGYHRVGKEDYPYAGAITTLYQKEITVGKVNNGIRILLSFKEVGSDIVFYKDLGITIVNLDRDGSPSTNDEIDRIENLLYRRLLEVAGEENVVGGERRDTRPAKPTFHAPVTVPPPRR
jgi:hypothetical protein